MQNKIPTHLRLLEGNRSKRPLHADPVAKGLPTPYPGLSADHLALWQEVVGSLPDGLLTAADNLTLERLVCTWSLYRRACEALAADQLMTKARDKNLVKNPFLQMKSKLEETLTRLTAELGLSPLARSRIDMPVDNNVDPMKQLLAMAARKYNTNKPGR